MPFSTKDYQIYRYDDLARSIQKDQSTLIRRITLHGVDYAVIASTTAPASNLDITVNEYNVHFYALNYNCDVFTSTGYKLLKKQSRNNIKDFIDEVITEINQHFFDKEVKLDKPIPILQRALRVSYSPGPLGGEQ